MMPAKVDDLDYINFLVAAQRTFTCTEASRSQPSSSSGMDGGDNTITRLVQPPCLRGPFFDRDSLWDEAKQFVRLDGGALVVDDSTLDKPYAEKMDLADYVLAKELLCSISEHSINRICLTSLSLTLV